MYNIPAKQHRHTDIIKRSEFIVSVANASSADEANAFVASIKKEFPDASHNCWAYVAGKPGDTASIGMSDDGEPHGTAGKPMLNVLLHSDIGEIVAVVTRYFGGTKLGPGGLVKAYSGAVKNTLEGLALSEKRQRVTLDVNFDYSYTNAIKIQAHSFDAIIINEQYTTDVSVTLEIPTENLHTFINVITDLTAGAVVITKKD